MSKLSIINTRTNISCESTKTTQEAPAAGEQETATKEVTKEEKSTEAAE
ncbi:MAG: hypothetical protein KUG73_09575 [Pseudomonadales bacterium]|nr:hypothetical protein [Pseudomonadales bacterium]